MPNTNTYFEELQEWSSRKHELLTKYLDGFMRILGSRNRQFYYIDGFAGPGIYGDGKKGSPVLAAEFAQTLQGKNYRLSCINVEVDDELYRNLEANTSPHKNVATNLCGEFGSQLDAILRQINAHPAIFFLDPFGVKGVEWKYVSRILNRPSITELLVRVNPIDLRRLAGFLDSDDPAAPNKRRILDELFGDSQGWEQAWRSNGEAGLISLYMSRLAKETKGYACRYPIRSIGGELKYFLLFATKHPKGAMLMNESWSGRGSPLSLPLPNRT